MKINKNTLLGVGAIGVGVFLAYNAKQKGKHVPIIGRLFPSPQ